MRVLYQNLCYLQYPSIDSVELKHFVWGRSGFYYEENKFDQCLLNIYTEFRNNKKKKKIVFLMIYLIQ